jgi:hypothetical protein
MTLENPPIIIISQARQGGFSSVNLPGPLELNPPIAQWTFLPTAIDEIQGPEGTVSADVQASTEWSGGSASNITRERQTTGGPYTGAPVAHVSTANVPPFTTWFEFPFARDFVQITSGTIPELTLTDAAGFTLECYAEITTQTGFRPRTAAYNQWMVLLNGSRVVVRMEIIRFTSFSSAVWEIIVTVGGGIFRWRRTTSDDYTIGGTNTPHHYALSCSGTSASLWVDGDVPSEVGLTPFSSPGVTDGSFTVPADPTYGTPYEDTIDAFRPKEVTMQLMPNMDGIYVKTHMARFTHQALYDAPFTPPQL